MTDNETKEHLEQMEQAPGLQHYAEAIVERFHLSIRPEDLLPFLHAAGLELITVVLASLDKNTSAALHEDPVYLLNLPATIRTMLDEFAQLADAATKKIGMDHEWWPTTIGDDEDGKKE